MTPSSRRQIKALYLFLLIALVAGGCATTFSRAERAASVGDWDTAVTYYMRAVQDSPNRPEYKVALERAVENAAIGHLDKGRLAEARGQLDEALREYRRASEYDPLNGEIAAKMQAVNRLIAERIEAARPKPPLQQLREQARQAAAEPLLSPASRQPIDVIFRPTTVQSILDFIAQSTGINITYDRDTLQQVGSASRQYSVELHGVTLEQALNQILMANQLFYKVLDPHTIIVVIDSPQKHQVYDEQVVQTFYISHADANELMQVINQVVRVPGQAVSPMLAANKTSNTITIRASAPMMKIFEAVIESNDKPRAELVIDVEVLEVNRVRAKQYGLDLNDYTANLVFSPGAAPGTTTSGTGTGTGTTTTTTPTSVAHTNLFGLNALRGFIKSDVYLSIPAATIHMLENDTDTKLVAKPQLRGSEGEKLTLNLGQQIPVPTTTFGAVAAGGLNAIPVSSFQEKDVGLNFTITPRVTFDNDIILTLTLENSTYQGNVLVAGQELPQFGQRKVDTTLRLRDGETNLLAGLLETSDQRAVTGFPGLATLPVFKHLFSYNNNQLNQTDIIMLLTPHIIRSHELTQRDVSPVYIGTQNNLALGGGLPSLIAPPAGGEQPPAGEQVNPVAPPPAAAGAVQTPPAAVPGGLPTAKTPVVPPGASPVPGTISPPPPAAGQAAGQPPATPPAAGTLPAAGQLPAAPPAAAATAGAGGGAAAPPGGGALVAASVSGPDFRVGGGPYTVPIMIGGATGISTMSVTVRYNPAVLRVRSVQDGSFMRQGGLNSGFTQQVDAANGRVDITFTRAGDTTGATGGGVVAAVLFDAVAAGSSTVATSGVATGPTGTVVPLQFTPATITVR